MKSHSETRKRYDPLRMECARAVLHLYLQNGGSQEETRRALDLLEINRAHDGLCGALAAYCALFPELAPSLTRRFKRRFGNVHCLNIEAPNTHPCPERASIFLHGKNLTSGLRVDRPSDRLPAKDTPVASLQTPSN